MNYKKCQNILAANIPNLGDFGDFIDRLAGDFILILGGDLFEFPAAADDDDDVALVDVFVDGILVDVAPAKIAFKIEKSRPAISVYKISAPLFFKISLKSFP